VQGNETKEKDKQTDRETEEIESFKTEMYVMSRTEMTPCLSKYRTAKTADNGETLNE
jgi:hypothetical protein